MTLRTQLLLIAVLILALPLSGWQFARQVERMLRTGHAEALESAARTAARQLAETAEFDTLQLDRPGIFVHRPVNPPFLDGYADDWVGFVSPQARQVASSVQALVAESGRSLHLLFEVDSDAQIYSRPGLRDGDQLILEFRGADGRLARVELAPMAPGFIETRGRNAQGWPRIQGYWQPRARGWTVELQLPDPGEISALTWIIVDAREQNRESDPRLIKSEGQLRLIRTRPALADSLLRMLPDQTQAWITLPSDWVIAHAERPADSPRRELESGWIDTWLFEGLANDSIRAGPGHDASTIRISVPELIDRSSASFWATRLDQPGVVLTAGAAIERNGQRLGTLVLEREADQLLLDSNRAVLRLLGISLGVFVLVVLILFGYATWLSERVRRLHDGLEAAVGDDGQVRRGLAASKRGDELGDLGRSVARLLARLREHQNYLRTLADKLAHELRTPLAMIRSSLDNLEAVDDPAAIARYRQRASEGSDRLNRIFQAMSQAARIEESLSQEDFDIVILNDYLQNYLAACRDTYPERRFRLIQGQASVSASIAPDLLAQLLDKLIDNAVDFSPEHSTIRLRLRASGQRIELDVENDGPPLPENKETLFDSMVSVRAKKNHEVHLGLGLSIVRLIAEHHGGTIQASDLANGVRFRLVLPLA